MGKDYEKICEWGNLYDAYLKARRGKRWKNSVAKVEASALRICGTGPDGAPAEVRILGGGVYEIEGPTAETVAIIRERRCLY